MTELCDYSVHIELKENPTENKNLIKFNDLILQLQNLNFDD